jgi:hypothetical protein
MTVKKKRSRAQVVDKKAARAAYDSLKSWQTRFPQAFHEVIDNVRSSTAAIRGAATCVRSMIAVEHTANLGLYAGVNGKASFKVAYPDWLPRRWVAVAKKGYNVGYAYGINSAGGYVAKGVPNM